MLQDWNTHLIIDRMDPVLSKLLDVVVVLIDDVMVVIAFLVWCSCPLLCFFEILRRIIGRLDHFGQLANFINLVERTKVYFRERSAPPNARYQRDNLPNKTHSTFAGAGSPTIRVALTGSVDSSSAKGYQSPSANRYQCSDASVAATETVGPHVSSRVKMFTMRHGPMGA